jgi:hypothetical protein
MKSIRQMLVVALVTVSFTSCRKAPDELPPAVVHGQVFVVLKPGNALKLALASVSVIPEADALAAAEAARKQCEATLGVAQGDISQELSSISNQLANRQAALRKEQEQLAAEVEAMRERRDFSETYASKVAAIGEIEDQLNNAETVGGREAIVRQNRENAVRRYPAEFAEALIRVAKPASVTRTNADGEFTLDLPKRESRVAILIEASRELETVERFVWFVWLDQLTADGGVYLFSNHNVLSADNNASVVNVAAALPET